MPDPSSNRPRKIRLPGFVRDEDIGVGQAIKYATARIGIRPCGGCERRAAALDRWFVIGHRKG